MERQETTRQRAPLPAAKQVKLKQSTVSENDLRHRAYEIYLNRGPNPGNEIGDWLQAEKELMAN
jgi:hypothetical protein